MLVVVHGVLEAKVNQRWYKMANSKTRYEFKADLDIDIEFIKVDTLLKG
ncbi:hypothetical protein LCGC14_2185350 [marine sediment metagenome]|uniref:Uncharacterized protein n=1 Tax=marine sediment metagenome TaxID=412755 RepID=A0A0F9FYI2_9ZZZZ